MIRTEEMSLNAWPSLQTQLFRGCILRFAEGYTKRANSANPLYTGPEDYAAVIDHCEQQYRAKGLPVVFKILDGTLHRPLDAALAQRGYAAVDTTVVMHMPLSDRPALPTPEVEIASGFSDRWLTAFIACNGVGRNADTAVRMLNSILVDTLVASISVDGQIIACGYGAVEDSHIGFFDIVVSPQYRGKGYGRRLMTGLIEKAHALGLKAAYLQVVRNNTPAVNLYTGLGFGPAYEYWYRRKQ